MSEFKGFVIFVSAWTIASLLIAYYVQDKIVAMSLFGWFAMALSEWQNYVEIHNFK